jgi:hydrogenase-4 component B
VELTLLAMLAAGLLAMAAVAGIVPRRVVTVGVIGISALMVALAGVILATGAGMATVLPIGPPGAVVHLAVDPLAASFLLLLFLLAPCETVAPLTLAGVALTVLAGDALALAVGLLLLGGIGALRVTAASTALLIVTLALLGSLGDFAALRSAPPEGWRAAVALLPALAGAGMIARVSGTIAAYLVSRVLFDLSGAEQPLWWGASLLIAGAATASIGSLRAALADALPAVLSAAPLLQFGMAVMALGVALVARAVDLPSVASLALGAAWLAVVTHALGRTLLLSVAQTVETGAGSRRLDRLGGLIHAMPVTAASVLVGLFAVAALPPGLGFAVFWLLFQALLSIARIGDPGLALLTVGVAAATAFSVGLTGLAAVRLFAVAFLGRPRTPRTAAAEDPPRSRQLVLGGVAAGTAVLGVLPTLALVPATGWTKGTEALSFLVLRTGVEAPGYSPIAVAVLLAVVAIAAQRVWRPAEEQRREPAWSGGFAPPPAWLPFGDPATQYGAVSFVEPLRRLLAALPPVDHVRHLFGRWCGVALRAATRLMVA